MEKSELKDLSQFQSINKLVAFFEDNDLGDYLDQMPEVEFEVNLQREIFLVTLDTLTARKITDIASSRQTTTTALIEDWLGEKVREYA